MAKKNPFDAFKESAIGAGASPLKNAVEGSASVKEVDTRIPVRPAKPEEPAVAKNVNRELMSFHIDKDLKKELGFIKFSTGKSYGDLINEAVEELVKKYK